MLLTRLILRWGETVRDPSAAPGPDQAARLAKELARFLDQVQTERLSFDRLADLVPEECAGHWQMTLDFLSLLTEHWPEVVAAEGCLDPAQRRNLALEAQARAWEARPPSDAVIAAGTTGSIPATADLLGVVARLPKGAVVLPGLDRRLDSPWPGCWSASGFPATTSASGTRLGSPPPIRPARRSSPRPCARPRPPMPGTPSP
jgi:ATP-dependent helicase/nuclease subunit B